MLSGLKYQIKKMLPLQVVEPGEKLLDAKHLASLSLQRSGQHAVINWLCTQYGNIAHFNFCHFQYMYLYNLITPMCGRFVTYRDCGKFDSGVQDQKSMRIKLVRDQHHYSQLLYSFEDFDIENELLRKFIRKTDALVIIIIRDPYNWLASTIKHNVYPDEVLFKKKLFLKKYLEQALGIKDYLQRPYVAVNYNKWVLDREYRHELCNDLGISYSEQADKALSDVQNFGGGSSFDGLSLTGDQLRHNVFNRWQDYISNPSYRKHLNDDYLKELSLAYFGLEPPF